ncbi:hypothetical protein VT03_05870 [Planctomyces sp. SH-PL14]|nr:hypothetical protein VT03_05870 [Planctomyces sp. SH-PL14]
MEVANNVDKLRLENRLKPCQKNFGRPIANVRKALIRFDEHRLDDVGWVELPLKITVNLCGGKRSEIRPVRLQEFGC